MPGVLLWACSWMPLDEGHLFLLRVLHKTVQESENYTGPSTRQKTISTEEHRSILHETWKNKGKQGHLRRGVCDKPRLAMQQPAHRNGSKLEPIWRKPEDLLCADSTWTLPFFLAEVTATWNAVWRESSFFRSTLPRGSKGRADVDVQILSLAILDVQVYSPSAPKPL